MRMTTRFIIYGLVDPRTDDLFYVGKSTSGLNRPKQHLMPYSYARADRNTRKARRIREIMAEGLRPVIRVLYCCRDAKRLEMVERVMINARGGLTNWKGYHRRKKK